MAGGNAIRSDKQLNSLARHFHSMNYKWIENQFLVPSVAGD